MERPTSTSHPPPVDVISDQDLIVVYRALDKELCHCVVDFFDHDAGKSRGKIITGAVFRSIHPKIQACMSHYLSRSPVLQSFGLRATGYKIQMYPRNEGYFRWHADSVGSNGGNRVVAMVLYLNDVEKGGETEFFHQKMKISPKAGHLVLFPTGWNYMHRGHTPESADKYIIQTFVTVTG